MYIWIENDRMLLFTKWCEFSFAFLNRPFNKKRIIDKNRIYSAPWLLHKATDRNNSVFGFDSICSFSRIGTVCIWLDAVLNDVLGQTVLQCCGLSWARSIIPNKSFFFIFFTFGIGYSSSTQKNWLELFR